MDLWLSGLRHVHRTPPTSEYIAKKILTGALQEESAEVMLVGAAEVKERGRRGRMRRRGEL